MVVVVVVVVVILLTFVVCRDTDPLQLLTVNLELLTVTVYS